MSIRFTYALLIFCSVILFCHSSIQVPRTDYKENWRCHWLCSVYNSYHFNYPNQACSTVNGKPASCEKKSIQLFKKGTFGGLNEIFEDHSLLKCVNDEDDIVGYLTAGSKDNEYLEWYNPNGDDNYYPYQFLVY